MSEERIVYVELQWSHDLSAMDTRQVELVILNGVARFNGAMTSQPWIRPR